MKNAPLPTDFWKKFHSEYWEKHPAIFKGLFAPPFITPEQLFSAITGMPSKTQSDRFWASKVTSPRVRNDFRIVPLDQHGPRQQDKSLEGFFSRIKQQMGDLPVGINIHELQKSQPAIWFKFRKFIHELNTIAGELPSGQWDIDTFLGTYKTTPLGIHEDNASVFAIGVMGHRTYYTWPAEYFKQGDAALSTLDTDSLQMHLDQAVRMDLGPGDLVYWPSSNWHFVTSDGQPSAVVSVSAYFGKNLSEIIGNQVRHLLERQLGDSDFNHVYTLDNEPTRPPGQFLNALNVFESMVGNGKIIDALKQRWLSICSADGMHPVLPGNSAAIDISETISVDTDFPIVWTATQDKGLLIAANGLTLLRSAGNNQLIIELLEHLNTGKPVVIGQLLAEYTKKGLSEDALVSLISTLQRFRAFGTAIT